MIKKIALAAAAIFSLLFTAAGAVDVTVDGIGVNFNESTGYPYVENGRTMVPLRASMEKMGAQVSWDDDLQTAIVRKGTTTVTCTVGESCIYRNGTRIENDAPAVVRNDRTYLPIRVVAEALDAAVLWDGNVQITSGSAGRLIYDIENSQSHVSPAQLWKMWDSALLKKAAADYSGAIETIKTIAPDFIKANDGNSNAVLYKHLGECYSALNMSAEAAECFKREAQFWQQMGKEQETIDANRRSNIILSSVQIYAKTQDPIFSARKSFNQKFEQNFGVYLGAYAEGDRAVHNPDTGSPFYMDEFPKLVGKDMASYLLYLPDSSPISLYDSHIKAARLKNKIMQMAIEPQNLGSITAEDARYVAAAKYMEESGAKFFVRFASEMNEISCPWYTENSALYIEKFRIVSDIFHKYAPNAAAVVWSPNFYPSNNIEKYYPGDKYVDYVGISSYMNHQPETDPLGQNIDRNRWSSQLDAICSLYAYKKPIIVSEGGASYMDYNTWGDITDFASDRLYDFYTYLPIKYPEVRAVYIYDNDRERYRFSLSANEKYLSAYKRAVSSEDYLSSIENGKYGYYELGENTPAEPKNVEISSYIKTVENDIAYVVYRINGADAATAYAIPYSVNIDFSKYSNQTVSISALAFNADGVPRAQKTYNIKVK